MTGSNWAESPILVIGAAGMLGQKLVEVLRLRFGNRSDDVVAADIDELDIRDSYAVARTINGLHPATVINAAAYTNVDGCESNVEEAMAVNAGGAGNVATACREIDALLVHFSTDFVFDGCSDRPYRPDDPPNPLSVYGRSKWQGEEAIRESNCRYLLIRTSWLFGAGGGNFVEAILSKAKNGERLRVVVDQVGRPTLTDDLSDGMLRLLDANAEGTYHFANSGECSWHEFAESIVRESGFQVPVERIRGEELGLPARRPAYSVLDLGAYTQLTHHEPVPWVEALRTYLAARASTVVSRPT